MIEKKRSESILPIWSTTETDQRLLTIARQRDFSAQEGYKVPVWTEYVYAERLPQDRKQLTTQFRFDLRDTK